MKRFWLIVTISLVFFSNTFSYAQRIERRDIHPQIIIPGPSVPQQKLRMPTFIPRPDIDYKIQRMVVDESIDYKMNKTITRKGVTDELRRRILSPFFKSPEIIEKIKNLPSESVIIHAESHPGNLYIIKVLGTLR